MMCETISCRAGARAEKKVRGIFQRDADVLQDQIRSAAEDLTRTRKLDEQRRTKVDVPECPSGFRQYGLRPLFSVSGA